jgi:hypothetical protein
MNAALKAQLQFIKQKFDFTSNVNVLNTDDFRTLVTSNDMVSFIYFTSLIILGELNCERIRY